MPRIGPNSPSIQSVTCVLSIAIGAFIPMAFNPTKSIRPQNHNGWQNHKLLEVDAAHLKSLIVTGCGPVRNASPRELPLGAGSTKSLSPERNKYDGLGVPHKSRRSGGSSGDSTAHRIRHRTADDIEGLEGLSRACAFSLHCARPPQ